MPRPVKAEAFIATALQCRLAWEKVMVGGFATAVCAVHKLEL